MEIFKDAGDLTGMALLLDDAAAVDLLAGERVRAFRLAGAAAAHIATTGAGLGVIVGTEEGRHWQQDISSDDDRRAWAAGQAMSLANALDYGLADPAVQASA